MFQAIKKGLDKLLETVLMIAVAVLVVDVLWQVFTRFATPKPSNWTEELAIILLVWVALLGGAVALGRGAHLGIDYFVGHLPERSRLMTEVFVFVCTSLFSVLVMIYGGIDLVRSTLELGQITPALHIKQGYVYLAVPISGGFMTLYSIIGLLERLAALRASGAAATDQAKY